ncbi:hypothetical protein BKA66DRAFT_443570 [Pyrenochaeta sp. MPI-SDFR-AT-0127]|nr:hypothetical protein BKA66DRAFT_443570 [Pyrenochaeta sp. MPI-SDFR-AT-0127]
MQQSSPSGFELVPPLAPPPEPRMECLDQECLLFEKAGKAYMLIRLASSKGIKPTVYTDFKHYDANYILQSSHDQTSPMCDNIDIPMLDKVCNRILLKAGIPKVDGDSIKVQWHSWGREILEKEIPNCVAHSVEEAMKRESFGQIDTRWDISNGGTVAHLIHENGIHIWWEVVDVYVDYNREDMVA